jgi:hypothetical protein
MSKNAEYGVSGKVAAINSFYYDGLNDYGTVIWDDATATLVAGPSFNDHCPLVVDAPALVVAFYMIAKAIERQEAEAKRCHDRAVSEANAEANRVSVGKTVEVVRGRKIKKGTHGVVFWCGETKWGYSVGMELPNGERHFTASHNVEVVVGPSLPLVGSRSNQKAA